MSETKTGNPDDVEQEERARRRAELLKRTLAAPPVTRKRPPTPEEMQEEIRRQEGWTSVPREPVDPAVRAAAEQAGKEYVEEQQRLANARSADKLAAAAGGVSEEGLSEMYAEGSPAAERNIEVTREEDLEHFGKIRSAGGVASRETEIVPDRENRLKALMAQRQQLLLKILRAKNQEEKDRIDNEELQPVLVEIDSLENQETSRAA